MFLLFLLCTRVVFVMQALAFAAQIPKPVVRSHHVPALAPTSSASSPPPPSDSTASPLSAKITQLEAHQLEARDIVAAMKRELGI